MLILKEVTHGDQGLYAIKLSSGFTYETVHLTVSGTVVSSLCEIHACFFYFYVSINIKIKKVQ